MKKIKVTVKTQSQPKPKFERDEVYKLTPKGCMLLDLYKNEVDPEVAESFVNLFWDSFEETLTNCGYAIVDKDEN